MFFRQSRKLDRLLDGQVRVEALLKTLGATLSSLSTSFIALQAAVAAQTAVDQSALTLIQGIAQQLKDNATDPAAVQALADQLNSASAPLAAAVAANTPSAPAGATAGTDPASGAAAATGDDAGSTGAASGTAAPQGGDPSSQG